jgi:hypothetical protein
LVYFHGRVLSPQFSDLEVGNTWKKHLIRSLFLIGSTHISSDSIDATVHDDLRLMFILFKVVDSFLIRSLFLIRSFLIGLLSQSGIVPSDLGLEIGNKCTKRLIRSLLLIRSFLIGVFSRSGIVPSDLGLEIGNKCTKRLIRSLLLIRSFLIGLFSWSGIVPSDLGLEIGNKCTKRLIRSFLIGSKSISVDSADATVRDDPRLMFILFNIVDSFLTCSLLLIRSFLIGLFSWSRIVPSDLGLEVGNKCTKRLIRSFLIGPILDSIEAMEHDDLRWMFILFNVVGFAKYDLELCEYYPWKDVDIPSIWSGNVLGISFQNAKIHF